MEKASQPLQGTVECAYPESTDRKHTRIREPVISSSVYDNYKKTVLTAVAYVDSLFTAISVDFGGDNDGTAQRNSAFGQALTRKKVNNPRD
jgi:hypothetical protein